MYEREFDDMRRLIRLVVSKGESLERLGDDLEYEEGGVWLVVKCVEMKRYLDKLIDIEMSLW